MRSYKQRCGLAKALDIVGDRWTLLIVRELLIREACRYTDLLRGLPGIATNMLVERLREMEAAGVVVREEAPPPVATPLFRLTEWGRELEPAILELGAWGAPLLAGAGRSEVLQPHWLVLPLRLWLADAKPTDPDTEIELRAGNEVITVSAARGKITVRLGAAPEPDVVVSGAADWLLHLFAGRVSLQEAQKAGIKCSGAPEVLRRVIPKRRAALA